MGDDGRTSFSMVDGGHRRLNQRRFLWSGRLLFLVALEDMAKKVHEAVMTWGSCWVVANSEPMHKNLTSPAITSGYAVIGPQLVRAVSSWLRRPSITKEETIELCSNG